jgi:hypothetical protein
MLGSVERVSGHGPRSLSQDWTEATEEMNMIRGVYDAAFEKSMRARVASMFDANDESSRLKSRRQAL